MLISKKKLTQLIDDRIDKYLLDKTKERQIAMEYLVGLKKTNLNRFYEAVDLRRQSEDKLDKLDDAAPDIDNIGEFLQ